MTMIMRADDGVGQKAGRRDTADGQWTPRLLIADDVPANIDLLMRILGSAGYHDIVSTTDGRAVVTTFQAAQPDIVLLDLHMPVPHSEVMQMIEQGAGTQFDPAVVRAMLAIGRAAAALDA
jgi:CheY-like chemotaxis protein